MSSIPTLPTVPVLAPPQADPYYGFGGQEFEISLNSPIFNEGSPPPVIVQAYFANGNRVFSTSGSDALYQMCLAMSARSSAFVNTQVFRYAAYCGWLSQNYEFYMPSATPETVAGDASLMDPVQAWVEDGMRYPPDTRYRFYITPFLPMQGLYQWLAGSGEDVTLPLRALNLYMVVTDFEPIVAILQDPNVGPGSYQINRPFGHNVFDHSPNIWAAGLIGRVTGNVVGTLTISDGSFTFDGSFTLNPDIYDANPDKRPFPQEGLTTFLQGLDAAIGATSYRILFEGEQTVHYQGLRP
ncbi:lipid II-degrading bacteriocin [Xanthomonas citri]|uniref:lipid II-degrading bacteriocin n=1 Tax=Xanthomonas citri TaxID=346 RepID=UPI000B05EFC8|nr:lipid II-degrading bacteriocin [Xanthomonas citri]QTJ32015.1 lipid II-degrading bacteriocin [Xanthomonas citri pv. phaseoli var. fuscans]QTK99874.1 lipid II-degrading bacteriocin [Xanthomonas citri pv. fuscans]